MLTQVLIRINLTFGCTLDSKYGPFNLRHLTLETIYLHRNWNCHSFLLAFSFHTLLKRGLFHANIWTKYYYLFIKKVYNDKTMLKYLFTVFGPVHNDFTYIYSVSSHCDHK